MRHLFPITAAPPIACSCRSSAFAALGIVLALSIATAAAGQVRGIRPPAVFQRAFEPDFEPQDFVVFQEVLDLAPNQAAVITTLLDDYAAACRAGSHDARERMNALRPERPRSPGAIRSSQEQMRREIEEMRRDAREAAAAADDPETARRIMEDYERRLGERMSQMQDEMQSLGFTSEGREDLFVLLEQMGEIAGAWSQAGDALAAEFVENVNALLNDEQRLRWPIVDRRLRREKSISRGKLSGESVDLIAIARDIEKRETSEAGTIGGTTAAANEELASVFENYDLRLDEALRIRNAYLDETDDDLFRATQLGEAEQAAAIGMRQIDLHRTVRDVNEEYIPSIAAVLPEERARAFLDAANRAGFPRVYRPTAAARVLKSAARLTGLDEGPRDAILALETEYLVLLEDANAKLRRAILREEPVFQKQQYERAGSRLAQGEIELQENPIRVAFDERRAFGDTYIERLRTLLPEDVFRRIPGAVRGSATRGQVTGADR